MQFSTITSLTDARCHKDYNTSMLLTSSQSHNDVSLWASEKHVVLHQYVTHQHQLPHRLQHSHAFN